MTCSKSICSYPLILNTCFCHLKVAIFALAFTPCLDLILALDPNGIFFSLECLRFHCLYRFDHCPWSGWIFERVYELLLGRGWTIPEDCIWDNDQLVGRDRTLHNVSHTSVSLYHGVSVNIVLSRGATQSLIIQGSRVVWCLAIEDESTAFIIKGNMSPKANILLV